jgi:hypothetical protein
MIVVLADGRDAVLYDRRDARLPEQEAGQPLAWRMHGSCVAKVDGPMSQNDSYLVIKSFSIEILFPIDNE